MRSKRRNRTCALVAAVLILLTPTWWGTGVSSADEHIPDHGPVDRAPEPGKNPGEQQTVVRYGPWTMDACVGSGGGHEHCHSGNVIENNVGKPCDNCYITAMTAAMVDEDGNDVGVSDDLMLHHMVLFNRGKTDPTCQIGLPIPLGLLFGQRFFASGDERTVIEFPPGYGYEVGTQNFNLIWEAMTMSTEQETFAYEVTYNWVPANTPGMSNVEPIWFDIDQCGVSAVNVPAGQSTRSWTWTVNRPGALTNIGGHVHTNTSVGGGVNIEITNDTTGELLCDSRGTLGETGMYVDHHGNEWLSSMSKCGGEDAYDPVAMLNQGERVTITGFYDQTEAVPDQMGIVMGYVAEDGPPPGNGGGGPGDPGDQCVTAGNRAHAAAGRAYLSVVIYRATGSDDYLGLGGSTTSLRETSPGRWERVSSC